MIVFYPNSGKSRAQSDFCYKNRTAYRLSQAITDCGDNHHIAAHFDSARIGAAIKSGKLPYERCWEDGTFLWLW
jgi:hypothetical protein